MKSIILFANGALFLWSFYCLILARSTRSVKSALFVWAVIICYIAVAGSMEIWSMR